LSIAYASGHSHCDCYGNCYCHTYPGGITDANTNSYCHSYAGGITDANTYCYCHGDSYSYSYGYSYSNSNGNTNCNGDSNGHAHSNCHSYGNSDGNGNCHSNGNTYGNSDSDSGSYRHSYSYGDRNRDINTYAHAQRDPGAQSYTVAQPEPVADAVTDTLSNACCADGSKGNECDCQQLYCELDQRERCDRLPVGRLHEQYLRHLRTGIPGSECRQLN
jgi:hypothetical protein